MPASDSHNPPDARVRELEAENAGLQARVRELEAQIERQVDANARLFGRLVEERAVVAALEAGER